MSPIEERWKMVTWRVSWCWGFWVVWTCTGPVIWGPSQQHPSSSTNSIYIVSYLRWGRYKHIQIHTFCDLLLYFQGWCAWHVELWLSKSMKLQLKQLKEYWISASWLWPWMCNYQDACMLSMHSFITEVERLMVGGFGVSLVSSFSSLYDSWWWKWECFDIGRNTETHETLRSTWIRFPVVLESLFQGTG